MVRDHSKPLGGASGVNEAEAAQAFNGLMLGDGGISLSHGTSPYFGIAKSGKEYADYLYQVKTILLTLGVPVSDQYPKAVLAVSRGKPYVHVYLYSRSCLFTEVQRKRWYPCGIKIVPIGLNLTPIALAYWFMDDGGSTWNSVHGQMTGGVSASFATYNFCLADIEELELRLSALGVTYVTQSVDKHVRSGSGVRLRVHGNSVVSLMDLVEPYMVSSYKMKIKRPTVPIVERHRHK